MSGRRATVLAARRELRDRLRSRAFRASTLVQLLVIAGIVVAVGVLDDSDPERYDVGVVGADARAVGETAQRRERAADADIRLRSYPSPAAARRAVADDDVNAAVVDGRILITGDAPPALTSLLQGASLRGPPPFAVVEVPGGGDAGGAGLAFVGSLLLYGAILTFGYALSSSVIEEKSSRVVELVLTTMRPLHLLAGKIAGIGLLGLAQVALLAAVGVGLALAIGVVDLPESTGATVALVLVYFVLGYAFYGCAFAAAGAIVSRQEDAQSTTTPLLLVAVAAYVLSLGVVDDPDGAVAQVGTFLPPMAPMVVPARAARDALPADELAVSIALMLAGTAAMLWLSARIYERTVLRYGAPLKLTQALRLAGRGA